MSGAAQQRAASRCGVNDGTRDAHTLLGRAYKTAPARHPAEDALYTGSARWHIESSSAFDAKLEECRLVEQSGAAIGGVGKLELDPRPPLVEGIRARRSAEHSDDIWCLQVHYQQPPALRHTADCTANFAQFDCWLAPLLWRQGRRRLDAFRLLVRQVTRIVLGPLGNLARATTVPSGAHSKPESRLCAPTQLIRARVSVWGE